MKNEFKALIDRLIAANNAINDGYEAGPRLIKNLPKIWEGKEGELRQRVEYLEAEVVRMSAENIETDENNLTEHDYYHGITYPNG